MTTNGRLAAGRILIYFTVAVAAATTGFGLYRMWDTTPAVESANQALIAPPGSSIQLVGKQRPDFTLPDIDGKPVSINRWQGKVVLINFWATWCPPCRKEIPAFMEVLKQNAARGFEIIGVAIDDREAVVEFVNQLGVSYPQLIGDQNAAEIAKRYGNLYGALPYSVLIDREGIIRFVKPGELHRELLEIQLNSLL